MDDSRNELWDQVEKWLFEGRGVVEIMETFGSTHPNLTQSLVWGVRSALLKEGVDLVSPYGMVQERVLRDRLHPWRIIVTCCLMNRTHARQVRPIMRPLFDLWSTPLEMSEAGEGLEDLIRPLGFYNRRATTLRRMSSDYFRGLPPKACRGVGQFASDALDVFVYGKTNIEPKDGFLKLYVEWKRDANEGVTR